MRRQRLGGKCQGEVGCSGIIQHKLDTGPLHPLPPPATPVLSQVVWTNARFV